MNKKSSELVQVLVFAVIAVGNLFLASRYFHRDDIIGAAIFSLVVILAFVALIGHIIEWKRL